MSSEQMSVRAVRIPVRDGTELAATLYLPAGEGVVGRLQAIQVALRRPPALKAIVAVDASDDLFHDDVHYIDGLLHLDEYALMIDHLNALPPAPDFPLDEPVLARFDREPWLATWLARQQDGPYWRRASLRPDYGRLTIPAFLIGGWYDGYRDSVPRMLAAVPAPVKVLLGPWNHTFPHDAVPGPADRMAGRGGPVVGPLAQGGRRTGSCPSRRSPCTSGTGTRLTRSWPRCPAAGGPRPRCRRSGPSTRPGTAVPSGTCRRSPRRTARWRCATCRRRRRPATGGAS